MYVQIRGSTIQIMKKLYEYAISNHFCFNFIKRIEIDEETKTVWFDLIVIDVNTNKECAIIKSKSDFTFKETNKNIKDFLFGIIRNNVFYLICELNLDYKIEDIFEQIDSGFIVNGKEFLLKGNNYDELREKVLNEVKKYGLH